MYEGYRTSESSQLALVEILWVHASDLCSTKLLLHNQTIQVLELFEMENNWLGMDLNVASSVLETNSTICWTTGSFLHLKK